MNRKFILDGQSRERCDFLILVAQGDELSSLLNLSDHVIEEKSYSETIYRLRIRPPDGQDGPGLVGVAAYSGIGRVAAAITASRLLPLLSPPLLFLVGIAGGFVKSGVALGDIIVADRIIDYEHQRVTDETQEFRLKYFETDDTLLGASRSAAGKDWYAGSRYRNDRHPQLHFGPMLSGDKVIASDRFGNSLLLQEPSVLGVEMEGAGVAAATLRFPASVRFSMIRGVVDLANEKKREDSQMWLSRTCEAVALFTIATLFELHYVGSSKFIP